MKPKRVMLVEDIALPDGVLLPHWTYAWKLGDAQSGLVPVEYRNREYRIPAGQVVETPVPVPSPDRLAALDPCFNDLKDSVQTIFESPSYFSVHRCPHDNFFLEDIRGGIAMYSLWIFLGRIETTDEDSLKRLWSGYHHIPDDAIFYLGIGR